MNEPSSTENIQGWLCPDCEAFIPYGVTHYCNNASYELYPPAATLEQDSGYQIVVCSLNCATLHEVIDWLAAQLEYVFDTGEKITHIDHFQFIQADGYWHCVATCTVHRQNEDT